jgi:hypothetical protein
MWRFNPYIFVSGRAVVSAGLWVALVQIHNRISKTNKGRLKPTLLRYSNLDFSRLNKMKHKPISTMLQGPIGYLNMKI